MLMFRYLSITLLRQGTINDITQRHAQLCLLVLKCARLFVCFLAFAQIF